MSYDPFTVAAIATVAACVVITGTFIGAIAEGASSCDWRDLLALTIGFPLTLILIMRAAVSEDGDVERAWRMATFREAIR